MTYLNTTPTSNTCPHCGSEGFTLCTDVTQYQPMQFDDGEWVVGDVSHQEPIWSGDGVRMMCAECGTYFTVP
jgi:hypothetical protein